MNTLTEIILKYSYSFLTLLILLILSAFFSGSETALFSLTAYERTHLRKKASRASNIIESLLGKPQELLMTILFSNMAVNISIFAISSMLTYKFVAAGHTLFAAAIGTSVLISVILFGEILPKAIAYHLRETFAAVIAGPIWIITGTLRPLISTSNKLLVIPAVRLIIGTHQEKHISIEELHNLLAIAKQDGYLPVSQAQLLERVAQMQEMKVKQLMIPRVEITLCEIHQPINTLINIIRQTRDIRIAIYENEIDNIVGIVRAKRVFLDNPNNISDILESATFVPEQQRIDQLLTELHKNNTDIAIAVDEYGGLAGIISFHDIAKFITGKSGKELPESDKPMITKIAESTYLIDGNLPIEEFCSELNVPRPDARIKTVAGLMLNLAGYLPKQGESVEYNGIKLTARKIEQNRITKILAIKEAQKQEERKQ